MCKKLISVRVDEMKYNRVKEKLEENNKGLCSWSKKTFSDLVDEMLTNYIISNKK